MNKSTKWKTNMVLENEEQNREGEIIEGFGGHA